MINCQRRGTESPDGFRFCGSCGAEILLAGNEPRKTRKVVSAMFCDVADLTVLGAALDPEVLRHVINDYFADMRTTRTSWRDR
jgi:class 3 adenylate cyclase